MDDSNFSRLIDALTNPPAAVTVDSVAKTYQRSTLIDPASSVMTVRKQVSTCSDPDCTKQDGVVIFVPGPKVLEFVLLHPKISEDERTSYLDRVGVPVIIDLVSEHDDDVTSLVFTLDDVRELVNRLSQAVAYADGLTTRKDPTT